MPRQQTKSKRKTASKVAHRQSSAASTIATTTSARHLVVVESPAKARTIQHYLGKDYTVEASLGHIKDLPEHSLGVDVARGFQPYYILIPERRKALERLKALAASVDSILLATDPDREGEAIAWHLAEELHPINPNIRRVLFYEITKTGVQNGIAQPRELDRDLVLSQQARRVMDRLIGYEISPWLSDALAHEVSHALSAGRVQSVALRLICEREESIERFQPIPFWRIRAYFLLPSGQGFWAELIAYHGKPIRNPEGSMHELSPEQLSNLHYLRSEAEAERVLEALRRCSSWEIAEVRKRRQKRQPPPPFTTSLLQQEASRRLGLSPRQTMRLAQQLYEGVTVGGEGPEGLITYMRTDSMRVSHEAQQAARTAIANLFGTEYLPPEPPQYTSKSAHVQDAHEAIRPTHLEYTPERVRPYLPEELAELYELIYTRFLASQMQAAELESVTVIIAGDDFRFRASGSSILFDGFLRAYAEFSDEDDEEERQTLPAELTEGLSLSLQTWEVKPSQTKPPSRYTEATLVKELDELGIGRPSTYATIVSTLFERQYVRRQRKQLVPTPLGRKVNDILVRFFPDIFSVGFTAAMEQDLDAIAERQASYRSVLERFYSPFRSALERAQQSLRSPFACPACGVPMQVARSRRGKRYLRCSQCGKTQPLPKSAQPSEPRADLPCPTCGAPMVLRQSRYGAFYGCSRYPECNGTRPLSSGVRCPQCGEGELVERMDRHQRRFWGCSRYPDCRYASRYRPLPSPCPQCSHPYVEERGRWSDGEWVTLWHCPQCHSELTPAPPPEAEEEPISSGNPISETPA
ncbi:MAG: type I DNA topoisomerase [Candidatus Kapabacteria bacterium]|nr:type I DNA topoisomerase [Candidatus Kapabacteria bacterium]